MAKILCRTKGNANPKGKPRVYFTCHPEDFDRYFDKLCEDIFQTHDCAIFYTEDMNAVIGEQDKSTDLESNNLFVVPVTFRLLSQPNRAMDGDIPFALEKHIPVLPFMMERGIDEVYAKKFGELQYLYPYSTDLTEISYEEKLKKYLQSVLISDEMAKRIRDAFDAYIFLSYRKKDRRYANELMRLIHRHPKCRDIAIWYDEFLTPGESFRVNIEKVLTGSKLFTLLVTPNLLEEPGGKPNFVMGEEYPAARKSGIGILPAEMEETDKTQLSQKFEGIPTCVVPGDEAFQARLLESVSRIATSADDDDPMHNFLIGLAYLEGIDMEVDRQRGLDLITSAAEHNLPEAMEKLFTMYHEGSDVALSYAQSAKWAERLMVYYEKQQGEAHPDTLTWMNNLALVLGKLGKYEKALQLKERCYSLLCKAIGEAHPDTLAALSNLAVGYAYLSDIPKALAVEEKAYTLRCKVLGKTHPDTLCSLNNIAKNYHKTGNYRKALALAEEVYTLRLESLGEEHPRTISALQNLATIYRDIGDYGQGFQKTSKAYALCKKSLGEEHPDTLQLLADLAQACSDMGDKKAALALHQKAYMDFCKVLGEEHPNTIAAMSHLAMAHDALGDYKTAYELAEKVYALRCRLFGEKDTHTISALVNLATIDNNLGNCQRAAALMENAYTLECEILGEEHPDTLITLNNLALAVGDLGDRERALELNEKVYTLRCKVLGEKHPETLKALSNLASCYGALGHFDTALLLFEKAYTISCEVLDREHPDTLTILNNITLAYSCLKDYYKEATALKILYDLQCRVLGEEDPRTKRSLDRFMILCHTFTLCRQCGGKLKGLFHKKCTLCGKLKDY